MCVGKQRWFMGQRVKRKTWIVDAGLWGWSEREEREREGEEWMQ